VRGRTAADYRLGVIVCLLHLAASLSAIAVEVQEALGSRFGFDMKTFACFVRDLWHSRLLPNSVQLGQARAILWSIRMSATGHMNFCDRDSHFIFGDACTCGNPLSERSGRIPTASSIFWATKLPDQVFPQFRNNFGFLNRARQRCGQGRTKTSFVIHQGPQGISRDVCPDGGET